ncbi:MAG: hypothetical protein RRY29_03855 [Desulfovibrionaceae bacterium]
MGLLVARDKATLRDLESYYSYEDALNLAEIIRVTDHNIRAAWKD